MIIFWLYSSSNTFRAGLLDRHIDDNDMIDDNFSVDFC